jgi:hypothetical protein
MTSLHRLITIILIWLVIAFLGAIMQGLALSLPPLLVVLVYVVMLLAAGSATWAIARAPAVTL